LRVCGSRPARENKERAEHDQASKEAAEEVERRAAHNKRHEEQTSLGSANGEWLVDRFAYGVKRGFDRHEFSRELREKPSHEVHRPNGHADTEDDSSEHAFGITLAKGKHQTADHNGDQR
jgi:hypothetical protein